MRRTHVANGLQRAIGCCSFLWQNHHDASTLTSSPIRGRAGFTNHRIDPLPTSGHMRTRSQTAIDPVGAADTFVPKPVVLSDPGNRCGRRVPDLGTQYRASTAAGRAMLAAVTAANLGASVTSVFARNASRAFHRYHFLAAHSCSSTHSRLTLVGQVCQSARCFADPRQAHARRGSATVLSTRSVWRDRLQQQSLLPPRSPSKNATSSPLEKTVVPYRSRVSFLVRARETHSSIAPAARSASLSSASR